MSDLLNRHLFEIAGIGEALWDEFPDYRRVGGAPLNFAFHCGQQGAKSYVVSALGADALGAELHQKLEQWPVELRYLQQINGWSTGRVKVQLSEQGNPSYEICENVAWDQIQQSMELTALAKRLDCVCFGTLARRNQVSSDTIAWFLSETKEDCIKVFDINLRQAYFTADLVKDSISRANVLKLSDEEIGYVSEVYHLRGTVHEQLRSLLEQGNLDLIAYTRGGDGSLLMSGEEEDDHSGCPCSIVDSVGAGDSFTATLCLGLLNGLPLSTINRHANQLAAYVCSQSGATPSTQTVLDSWGV